MKNPVGGRSPFVALGLMAFFQVACDHTALIRCYEPPSRPLAEVSILMSGDEHNLILKDVNNWTDVNDTWFTIEMLPGEQTLTFGFYLSGYGTSVVDKKITFRAEPGILYVAKGSMTPLESRDVDWTVTISPLGPIPKDFKRPQFRQSPARGR